MVAEYSLDQLFDKVTVQNIVKQITDSRKAVSDDNFSYDPIEKTVGSNIYLIKGHHISVLEAIKHGKSNCKDCWGTGKKILSIEKKRISNPNDFIMLSSVVLKDLTEEQQKIWIEKEKQNKFWKILLPCKCSIKNMVKKGYFILSNDIGNIIVKVTCEDAPSTCSDKS